MHSSQHRRRTLLLSSKFAFVLALLTLVSSAYAQDKSAEVAQKLAGFDAFMEKTLKDLNALGIVVGIFVGDKLVLGKSYGYRDYEKKLPITANTL